VATTAGSVTVAAGSPLNQYTSYAFSATATEPTLGRTIVSFIWDFGDGTGPTTYPASAGTSRVTHSFAAAGPFTGSVLCVDDQGLRSAAAAITETVTAGPTPVIITAVNPTAALTLQVQSPLTTNLTFQFTITDTAGTVTLPATGSTSIAFNPGEASATLGAMTTDGSGNFTVTATYPSGNVGDSTAVTPTLTVTDNLGNSSAPFTFPVITIVTTGVNHPPTLIITTPASPSTNGFTSKAVNLGFTLTDQDKDVVTYTVDWGDGTKVTGTSGSADTTVGATIGPLTHIYSDKFTASTKTATVTVTADDGRTPAPLPQKTCSFNITFNAFPTATITTPQASNTLPSSTGLPSNPATGLVNPPNSSSPELVVIPNGGKLNFSGTATLPGSGDTGLTYNWTFQNGAPVDPSLATTATPGDVFFFGNPGVITPSLVTFTVTDTFGRLSSQGTGAVPQTYQKWVIVDGSHTQDFNLAFLYRQRSGTSAPDTYSYAVLPAHGNNALVNIFQDGMNNTYAVSDGSRATVTIPVRSDVPFWLSIPPSVAGDTSDATSYMFSIPNAQGLDPDMEKSGSGLPRILTAAEGTAFAFQSSTAPWNPQLQLTTGTGFGTEVMAAGTRTFQGTEDLVNNFCDVTGKDVEEPNLRWLDRLSVPLNDTYPVQTFTQANNVVNGFSGILGYQSIPEWFVFVKAMETRDINTLTPGTIPNVTGTLGTFTTAANPSDLGFVIADAYIGDTQTSQHYSISAIEAFRAPASKSDPYDFDVLKAHSSGKPGLLDYFLVNPNTGTYDLGFTPNGNPDPAGGLNPTPLGAGGLNFLSGLVTTPPSFSPLTGGLSQVTVSYDFNSHDRAPNQPTTYRANTKRSYLGYAEYLWTKVWARPLVLNRTSLNWADTEGSGYTSGQTDALAPDECAVGLGTSSVTFPYFFYSNPTNPWPAVAHVSPNDSAYDLNVANGGAFDASSPVTEGGLTGTSTGVGRFFWTAFTPHYNAVPGSLISRTWLADGSSQIPTTFPNGTTSDATTAWGLLPPQDTFIDKRARGADGLPLSPETLGGYRVQWFNPTTDGTGAPVPPDFWAVELTIGSNTQLFLLSASYPRATAQTMNDSLVTDARRFLPSNLTTYQTGDLAGPGYCWFDVPPELRPTSGTATVTVFALKSILKNNAVGSARVINRSEWVEAVKTVTANISTKPGGHDVSFAHKIPFNYPWDIVVVNGPVTPVAP
jgi:hypothetical protein